MSDKVIVIGHKNPDLDSVASAVGLAYFKNKISDDCEWIPARAGELDDETIHVLKKFGFKTPERIDSVEGRRVALVDHCTYCQMVDGVNDAEIVEIVDHHNIGDVETKKPIRFHSEPVGSTSTIIFTYFKNYNIEIPKNIAKLLLAALISDTDLFKSPTTTPLDLKIKKELEEVSGLNSEELGIEMFEVKSDLKNKTINEIITEDFKEYDIPLGFKLACSQVKLMELNSFLKNKKNEVIDEMKKIKQEKNYGMFIVIITDLIKEGSEVIVVGKEKLFEDVFKVKLKDNSVYIKDLMSRKKQVIPQLIGLKE